MSLFQLSQIQAEGFANKAGLSLFPYRKLRRRTHEVENAKHSFLMHTEFTCTEGKAQGSRPARTKDCPEEETGGLVLLLKKCGSGQRRQLYHLAVSERMVQHYLLGKVPTKQALLAIAVILELSMKEMGELLRDYGYSLSHSLANDAVVRWFWENRHDMSGADLLYAINDTLDCLKLPLLMTKQITRQEKAGMGREK